MWVNRHFFNRICRKRSAIVDFEEGITRDRKYQDAEWSGIYFTLVDTGGIIPRTEDTMNQAIRNQAEVAISEADVILLWSMPRRVQLILILK